MFHKRCAFLLSLLLLGTCSLAAIAQQTPTQVLIERARMLDAQGRHDLAAENWRHVLLLEPHQPDGLAALVSYYRGAGDQAKAESYQRLLNSVHPAPGARPTISVSPGAGSNDARLSEAARLSAAHQYSEALTLFRQVVGNTPPDNWAVAYYGTEAAIPSESAHGIAGLRALAAKYPANPSYQLALARELTYRLPTRAEGMRLLSVFRGTAAQNEQARTAWRTAILWDPNSRVGLENFKAYLERYPDAELSARFQAASQKSGTEAPIPAEEKSGYQALTNGNLTEATSHFTVLSEEESHAARGEMGLGYISMQQKDFDGALNHFEKARAKGMRGSALDKALHDARYWGAMAKGNDALKAKDTAKAVAEFTRAHEVDNHLPEAAEALGGALIASRQPQQAEEVLASNAKANPARPDAWIEWMHALLENSKFDRVISIQQSVPSDVRVQLAHRADYLAMLLCADLAQGNAADSRMLRERITRSDSDAGGASANVQAAGLLFRYGYFDDASRLSVAALNRDMNNAQAWQILVQAEHMAGRDRNALTMIGRMPHTVDATAMANSGFLLALASIYQSEGQLSNAKALLGQAQKLSGTDQDSLIQLDMQKASLALAEGDSKLAYLTYQKVTSDFPDQLDAWIGMLSALHAGKYDAEALAAMHDLPDSVSDRLRHDAAFLQTAGFVYSATGHNREALLCLRAVTDHYAQQHQPVPFGTGIELAWLLLNAGDQRQLAATLDRLGKQRSLSVSQSIAIQKVWAAWSMRSAEATYVSGDAKKAVAILQAAVQAYPADSTLRSQLANMYVRTDHASLGMKIYRNMDWTNASVDQFTAGINAAIASHNMSDAKYWLYLGLEKYPRDAALLRAGAHVEESKGNLKSAEKYLKLAAGSEPAADSMTQASVAVATASEAEPAEKEVPDTTPISALARMLAGTGGTAENNRATQNPSNSPEPQSTVDPTIGLHRQSTSIRYQQDSLLEDESATYLQPGVHRHDSDGGLVRVGAEKGKTKASAAANDIGTVEQRSTIEDDSLPNRERAASGKPSEDSRDAVADPLHGRDLGLSSNRADGSSASSRSSSATSLSALLEGAGGSAAENRSDSSSSNDEARLSGPDAVQPDGFVGNIAGVARFTVPADSAMLRGGNPTQTPTPSEELAELQARYSPFLLGSGIVETHSGTAGFDHLQRFEAEMGATTVLGFGAARLSVITRPVLLQSGVPDGTSNYRFGSGSTLPTDTQFASGTAGSLQLTTHTLQASVGFSPSGFLVNNFLGSIAVRPLSGPFTLSAYRTSQKDSLLSYAGMRDPDTGQVWGGVVATGGAVQFSRGSAASGFYASIDGQKLTGVNVAENTRVMGNAGAYWLAYSNQYGDLKVGANLTAMHYALNERYFTIGQGGYFSPNAFLLMNAPVTWQGRPIHDINYMIGGSLGAQSIEQAAAQPGSLIMGSGVETSTGASYDLHFKVARRMDAHWTLEGFLDANNARQYTDTSGGFTVRYSTHPSSGEAAGPGFINLTEPLPLQAP
jgi:Flp pilus assembly protein TadD